MAGDESLVRRDEGRAALRHALALWAEATTDAASARRADLLRDKQKAVADFFARAGKNPAEVTPLDVEAWRRELERRRPRLAPATIYYGIARLASFYSWAMRHTALGQVLNANPVHLTRPKAPKKYQTEAAKSWPNRREAAIRANKSLSQRAVWPFTFTIPAGTGHPGGGLVRQVPIMHGFWRLIAGVKDKNGHVEL